MTEENKIFGRYLITRLLGSGATSEVYLARDTKLDRQVALKILKPTLVADQSSFERFTREAQAASKLFHDHIATVLDMGEIEGRYYIAMRYVDGVSLDKFIIQNGPLKWEQALKLARQVGSAIAFAHQQQFLHRDIKPNNIMVSSKGDFVLTDFGLTRAMQDSGMTSTIGAVMGTPPYIPPEIWNGKPASPQSDLYSFACVIDEALTGRVLFAGATPQEIITKHLVNKPEIGEYTPEVPPNVRHIIQKALSKNSKDRFVDVNAFVAALENPKEFNIAGYLQGLAEVDRSAADKARLEKIKVKKRRKGCTIAVLVTLLVALLVCGISYLVLKDRIRPKILQILGVPSETQAVAVPLVETEGQFTKLELTDTPTTAEEVDEVSPAGEMIATEIIQPTKTATKPPQPTNTPQPTFTATKLPTQTSTSTQVAEIGDEQVPLGSGVEITQLDNGKTGLVAYFLKGDGNPIIDRYVAIYSQKQDLSGNWITDKRISSDYTDNAGSVSFNIPAGSYIVSADFAGYNWGSAKDVEGQADIPVTVGKTTKLVLRLARLRVGFVYASGSMVEDKYVKLYSQQKDNSNRWVTYDSVASDYTDNSGEVIFNVTPGNYIVSADFAGYNWGDAVDVEGMSNIPLWGGIVKQIVTHLGRITVEVFDSSGNPKEDAYVKIYFQSKDANGKPVAGNDVASTYTDNTGTAKFSLTPGIYVISYGNTYYYDIEVFSGMTTITDGKTFRYED